MPAEQDCVKYALQARDKRVDMPMGGDPGGYLAPPDNLDGALGPGAGIRGRGGPGGPGVIEGPIIDASGGEVTGSDWWHQAGGLYNPYATTYVTGVAAGGGVAGGIVGQQVPTSADIGWRLRTVFITKTLVSCFKSKTHKVPKKSICVKVSYENLIR